MNDINFDKSFLGKKTDFSSQVKKKKKVKVSTHDILIRLGAFDDERFNQKVSLKKTLLSSKNLSVFNFESGAVFYHLRGTHYIEAKSGDIFIIKNLDGRDVKINEKFVEHLKKSEKSVSYVEISKEGVKVTGSSGNNEIDALVEMFKKCVNIKEVESAEDDDSEEDSKDHSVKHSEGNSENKLDFSIETVKSEDLDAKDKES